MDVGKNLKLEEAKSGQLPDTFFQFTKNVVYERIGQGKDEHLEKVFSFENDLMVCILLTVFLENGFIIMNTSDKKKHFSFDINTMRGLERLPEGCRNYENSLYTIKMVLSMSETYLFHFLGIPTCEEIFVMNLMVKKDKEVLECYSRSFVPMNYMNIIGCGSVDKLGNVRELVRSIRDTVLAIRTTYLNKEGLVNPSLLGLPQELKERILTYLPVESFISAISTCRALHYFSRRQAIWRHFLVRDFNLYIVDGDEFQEYRARRIRNRLPATSSFTSADFRTDSIVTLQLDS